MQLSAPSLLFLLGLVSGVTAGDNGYGKTCNSISFYNARNGDKVIFANCRKPNGVYNVGGDINTATCFANANGNLVGRKDGGYPGSCKDMGMKGTVLHANCKNDAGTYVYTSIDTNDWIANHNGHMYCFGVHVA